MEKWVRTGMGGTSEEWKTERLEGVNVERDS